MSSDAEKRPREPSRVVFVGNIPFGLSEVEMSELFSSAGKVLSFRMVYDSSTGRTRGYGFAEYPDIDSASSAVRNLNDYAISGRKLKVDFSSERPHHNVAESDHQPAVPSSAASGPAAGSSLPPLPHGKDLMAGVTCTDAVSRTLAALPPAQLLDILTQLKALAATDPSRAADLLAQAPQLSYAVFQALLIMGLISPEAIHSVIDPGSTPVVGPPQTLPVVGGNNNNNNNTPPAGGYAPAPLPQQQPVAPAPEADADLLMRQVMELPQAMIDALPDAERQQIIALRNSYGTQGR